MFDAFRFEAVHRNEAEDQLLVVEALVKGHRLAYLEDVQVMYHVHAQNSSAVGSGSVEKRLRVFRALIAGFEGLKSRLRFRLTPAQARAQGGSRR